jgi:hypothetical protein
MYLQRWRVLTTNMNNALSCRVTVRRSTLTSRTYTKRMELLVGIVEWNDGPVANCRCPARKKTILSSKQWTRSENGCFWKVLTHFLLAQCLQATQPINRPIHWRTTVQREQAATMIVVTVVVVDFGGTYLCTSPFRMAVFTCTESRYVNQLLDPNTLGNLCNGLGRDVIRLV